MEFQKLESVIFEMVQQILRLSQKNITNRLEIENIAKKCFELSISQINLVMTEYFETGNLEKMPLIEGNLTDQQKLDQVKTHLKKIKKTLNDYYDHQDFLENESNVNCISKAPASIIDKLVGKLKAASEYEPDFILNIRDISLESWKNALDFENNFKNERLRLETLIVSIDTMWRNRIEQVKYKTATKINYLEKEIEKQRSEINTMKERLWMIINDIISELGKNKEKLLEVNESIAKAGFKDLKSALKAIKNIQNLKNRHHSQIENLKNELKTIKQKLGFSMNQQDSLKETIEKNEEIIKVIHQSILLLLPSANIDVNNKIAIEGYVKEKNHERIFEILSNLEDIKSKNTYDLTPEVRLEKTKNNKLLRNKTEIFNLSPKKTTKNQKINSQRIKSVKTKEEILGLNSLENFEEEIKKNENLTPRINKQQTLTRTTSKSGLVNKNNFQSIKEEYNKNKEFIKAQISVKNNERLETVIKPVKSSDDILYNIQNSPDTVQKGLKGVEKIYIKSGNRGFPDNKIKEKVSGAATEMSDISDKIKNKSFSEDDENINYENINYDDTKAIEQYTKYFDNQSEKVVKEEISPTVKFENKLLAEKINFNSEENRKSFRNAINNKQNQNRIKNLSLETPKKSASNVEIQKLIQEFSDNTPKIQDIIHKSRSSMSLLNENSHKYSQLSEVLKAKVNHDLKKPVNPSQRGWKNLTLKFFILLENYLELIETQKFQSILEVIYHKIALNCDDDIINYIKNSNDAEAEIFQICQLMKRSCKYELLSKILNIPKKLPYTDWKGEKMNMINKIRWTNLINKLKLRQIQSSPENLIFKIASQLKKNDFFLQKIRNSKSLSLRNQKMHSSMKLLEFSPAQKII